MKLYHTSDVIVSKPDISFSREYLDFGIGFYTTSDKTQAEKYAKRFFKEQRQAYLNIYQWDELMEGYTHKTFEAYDGAWLDYVVACRNAQAHKHYDLIEGGIADDDVFNTLDLYMSNLIPKDEAIKRLKKKRPNWQICFCSQQLINEHLHYIESFQIQDLNQK